MKKRFLILNIIFILVIVFTSSYKNIVHGEENNFQDIEKTLVVRVNSDISKYFVYDDYVVINNNVNVSQAGVYSITYKNIISNESAVKEVIVVDDDSYSRVKEVFEFSDDETKYSYLGGVVVDNQPYFLECLEIEKRVGENILIKSIDGTSQQVVWGLNGHVEDFKHVDGHYLGCGYQKNSYTGDIEIFYFDLFESSKYLKNIVNVGYEIGTCITMNDNYYFIGGYTNQSSELFNGKINDQDSVLVIIDKETFEVKNSVVLSYSGDDYIVDVYYDDSMLYLLQYLDNKNYRLLKCDIFGNIQQEKIINVPYGYDNIQFKYNNGLYLSYSYYDYSILENKDVIYKVEKDLQMNKILDFYNAKYKIKDYYLKDDLIELLLVNKKDVKGYLYQVIDLNNDSTIIECYSSNNYYGVSILDNYVVSISDGKFNVERLESIYVKEDPINKYDTRYNTIDNIINYQVLINCKKVTCLKPVNDDFVTNVFGTYSIDYYFSSDIDFLLSNKIEILSFIGVEDGGIYDKGIEINGNGVVWINNKEVELPYKIVESGKYTIEIVGLNSKKTINFTVEDISLCEEKSDSESINVDIIDSKEVEDIKIICEKRVEDDKKTNNFFYLYFIPIITLIIGFVVVRKGGK